MDFHGIPWRYFTRVGRVPLLGGLESLFMKDFKFVTTLKKLNVFIYIITFHHYLSSPTPSTSLWTTYRWFPRSILVKIFQAKVKSLYLSSGFCPQVSFVNQRRPIYFNACPTAWSVLVDAGRRLKPLGSTLLPRSLHSDSSIRYVLAFFDSKLALYHFFALN